MDTTNKQLANKRSKRVNNPPLYPILLNGANKRALVVGGGQVAERKIHRLLSSHITVTIISPCLTSSLRRLAEEKQVCWIDSTWEESSHSVADFDLVFAATNDRETNRSVEIMAKSAEVLVNIADDPDNSNFHTPSVIQDLENNVTITISTGGTAPGHSRKLREKLENFLRQSDALK